MFTDAELAEWERRFLEAHATGKVRVIPPLPWRTRLRLWLTGRVNYLGCWLADNDHPEAARWLWRICRMW